MGILKDALGVVINEIAKLSCRLTTEAMHEVFGCGRILVVNDQVSCCSQFRLLVLLFFPCNFHMLIDIFHCREHMFAYICCNLLTKQKLLLTKRSHSLPGNREGESHALSNLSLLLLFACAMITS